MSPKRKKFGNTTKLGELLERLNASDESARAAARDELISEAFRRIDQMASAQLDRFPRLRMKGRVDTADVSTDVLIDLRESLGTIPVESGRHFVNLAARKIRYKLLDLARRHKKQIELIGTNAPLEEGGPQRIEQEGEGVDRVGRHGKTELFRLKSDLEGLSFEEWESFHLAIDEMPDAQKEAFTLRYYGGWSHAEVGSILGISEDAAKKRYSAAKESLKDILSRSNE